jgi:glycosyltransferase A (GT-A) superfamily protein (DUF2064 family)
MLKRPQQSKRRIAAELGARADELAQLLLACALEDLAAWPGAVCLAPASPDQLGWAETLSTGTGRRYLLAQRSGNLGQRIVQIDGLLRTQGEQRVIMLGTDCPTLDAHYLAQANAALHTHEVVLGPARDGGVVLMGSARPWPDLAPLPWSTADLDTALAERCRAAGCRVARLAQLADVDTVADVRGLALKLTGDARASRRALSAWLAEQPDLLQTPS